MWPQIAILIWMVLSVVLIGIDAADTHMFRWRVMNTFWMMIIIFWILYEGGFWKPLGW